MADKQELERAEQDIMAAQRRVDQQKQAIETLRRDSHDTAVAKELLEALEHSLVGMKQHRNIMLEELGLYGPGESGTHLEAGATLSKKGAL
jgi:hypothetical protein